MITLRKGRCRRKDGCITIAPKNIAFLRSKTDGNEQGRPAMMGYERNCTATVGANMVGIALAEENDNVT